MTRYRTKGTSNEHTRLAGLAKRKSWLHFGFIPREAKSLKIESRLCLTLRNGDRLYPKRAGLASDIRASIVASRQTTRASYCL
jgi:hypothetical protein